MTTKEAIQAMLDGKKARGKNWLSYLYVCFNGAGFINEQGAEYFEFSEADDWEIYEEPKPKQTVIIEKWLCSVVDSYYIMEGTKKFFEGRAEKLKHLDTYEIEL